MDLVLLQRLLQVMPGFVSSHLLMLGSRMARECCLWLAATMSCNAQSSDNLPVRLSFCPASCHALKYICHICIGSLLSAAPTV